MATKLFLKEYKLSGANTRTAKPQAKYLLLTNPETGKKGIWNNELKFWLVSPEFDSADQMNDMLIRLFRNNKCGIYDLFGKKWVVPVKFATARRSMAGTFYVRHNPGDQEELYTPT